MKKVSSILLIILATLLSCIDSKQEPNYKVGDYWVDKFDRSGLQNSVITDDLLFANTIKLRKGQDYLYCFNLSDGKVKWRSKVDAYATQPIAISGDQLFYVSFLGEIYSFSKEGKTLWTNKLGSSYGGHKVNNKNGNLLVETVTQGIYEYDKESGKKINQYNQRDWNSFGALNQDVRDSFVKKNIIVTTSTDEIYEIQVLSFNWISVFER